MNCLNKNSFRLKIIPLFALQKHFNSLFLQYNKRTDEKTCLYNDITFFCFLF